MQRTWTGRVAVVIALTVALAFAATQAQAQSSPSAGSASGSSSLGDNAGFLHGAQVGRTVSPIPGISLTAALRALESGSARAAWLQPQTGTGGSTLTLLLPNRQERVAQVVSTQSAEQVLAAARKGGVDFTELEPKKVQPTPFADSSGFDLASWIQTWGPLIMFLAIVLILAIMLRQMGGARFTSKVKPVQSEVGFDDVAGIDEIRDEVLEIADYLKNPERYRQIGATLPKGIVLYGAPGTGKTLLAKAVAGEAGVPFFSASGAEFIEVYVGVGAKRIRHLFEAARKAAPSLLYIDEIDAIGERRSGGPGEREHTGTLDQLLTEMDGFDVDPTKPVVVLASTNRLEHLDPALLRSGRFDRKIAVGLPDRTARERILGVHMRRRPLAPGVELGQVAAFTAGMAGADLASLCNEASFEATRAKRSNIRLDDFRRALMRLAAGPEKRTQVLTEAERTLVAYHEMGHAIVGHMLPNCEPVERVTVIPQGQALGVTFSLPDEDRFLATRQEHLDRLARIMGGRAAEELIFGEMTSGAADDLKKATALAHMMVVDLGMARATTEESLAVGLAGGQSAPAGAERVEAEIQAILASAYRSAYELLQANEELLHRAAGVLLDTEALDREEIDGLLGPRPVVERFTPRQASRDAAPSGSGSTAEDAGMDDVPAAGEVVVRPFRRFEASRRYAQAAAFDGTEYEDEALDLPAEAARDDLSASAQEEQADRPVGHLTDHRDGETDPGRTP